MQAGAIDVVMPRLDRGSHCAAVAGDEAVMEWIAGSSPAMTTLGKARLPSMLGGSVGG